MFRRRPTLSCPSCHQVVDLVEVANLMWFGDLRVHSLAFTCPNCQQITAKLIPSKQGEELSNQAVNGCTTEVPIEVLEQAGCPDPPITKLELAMFLPAFEGDGWFWLLQVEIPALQTPAAMSATEPREVTTL